MFIKLLFLLTLPFYFSSGYCFLSCQLYWLNNRRVYECTGNSSHSKACDSLELLGSPDDLQAANTGRLLLSCGTVEVPSGIMALYIRHAYIEELRSFESPEVVTLVMQHCGLVAVKPSAFRFARNLQHLDLSYNRLQNIEFRSEGLKIDKLVLSNNLLTGLPRLGALYSLKYLDLSNNAIKTASGTALLLPKLDFVDLSRNALTTIRKKALGESIKFLVLDGNPWFCDCHLREFVEFQRETYITKALECAAPGALRGVKWDDLMPLDFACGPEIDEPDLSELAVLEGQTFGLSCSASGDPIPVMQFKKNASEEPIVSDMRRITINQSSHANYTTKVLQFHKATGPDEGVYWCVATTGRNVTAKQYDVTVYHQNGRPYRCRKGKCDGKGLQEPKGKAKSGTATLLSVITGAIIVVSLLCLVLALYYKRRRIRTEECARRKSTFSALPKLIDQADSEAQSTKQLLYEEPEHPIVLVTEPEDGSAGFHAWLTPTETESTAIKECGSQKETTSSAASVTLGGSRTEICPRKAPLAQYDRDTYVFPIVQTSL